jgi:hypothetical protein
MGLGNNKSVLELAFDYYLKGRLGTDKSGSDVKKYLNGIEELVGNHCCIEVVRKQ